MMKYSLGVLIFTLYAGRGSAYDKAVELQSKKKMRRREHMTKAGDI
jgi:hypothetical protein